MAIDPISGSGMILGLLAWYRSETGGRLSKDEILKHLSKQDTIRDYCNWLKGKEHSQLLLLLENHQIEVLNCLDDIAPSLKASLTAIHEQIIQSHGEIQKLLDGLSQNFFRLTFKDIFRPYEKPDVLPPYFRRPSYLLDAKNEVVPFSGRKQELANLYEWTQNNSSLGIRIYSAAGGMGKTRLFLEFCRELRGKGWIAGFLADDFEDFDRRAIRHLMASQLPQLFVVDYPHERSKIVEKLLESLAQLHRESRVSRCRVVLLVRELGDWWHYISHKQSLREVLYPDHLITDLPIPLGPVKARTAPDERTQLFTAAANKFREILGIQEKPLPQIDLSPPVFDRILAIHMAAFSAVCGRRLEDENALLNFIVEREKTRIQESFQDSGFDPRLCSPAALQVMALITLAGGMDKANAEVLSTQLSSLKDFPSNQRRAILEVLHTLYPQNSNHNIIYIAAIEPDLLGEHFISGELMEWKEAFSIALKNPNPISVAKAISHINRIAGRLPDFESALETELSADFKNLGALALEVAKSEPRPIAKVLTQIAEKSSNLEDLAILEPLLPAHTSDLIHFGYHVTKAALNVLPTNDAANRARLLNHLGNWLAHLGRCDEALPPTQDAIAIYRTLAAANQQLFLPALAICLNNLSIRYHDLGQNQAAVQSAEDAVRVFRGLASSNFDAFMPNLATSTNTLAARLFDNGQTKSALATSNEAVSLWKQLTEKSREANLSNIASTYHNRSVILAALHEYTLGIESSRNALMLYRQLAANNPHAYTRHVCLALNTLSTQFKGMRNLEDCLPLIEECVSLARNLVNANREAYLPDLASTLCNQATILMDLGKYDGGGRYLSEAISFYRELAHKNPAAFLPMLAGSLQNIAIVYFETKQLDLSVRSDQEVVFIYNKLAKENRPLYLKPLANATNNLALTLRSIGKYKEALYQAQESTSLSRELQRQIHDEALPSLANSLKTLALVYKSLAANRDALQAIQEATTIWQMLFQKDKKVFAPDLARTLATAGSILNNLDRVSESIRSYEQAILVIHPFLDRRSVNDIELHQTILRELMVLLKSARQSPPEEISKIIEKSGVTEEQPPSQDRSGSIPPPKP